MRILLPALALLIVLVTGCASTGTPEEQALAHSYVRNSSDAIAAVRYDITSRHGNPDAAEYKAGRRGAMWFVTAWHIRHANAKGSARFEPGGYTSYLVSSQGRVIESVPGH